MSRIDESADIILRNGPIITMEEELPVAEAIAIRGNLIMAIGSEEAVRKLQGDRTEIIDLNGRTMMPGFIDAHTHLLNDASYWDSNINDVQDLAVSNGITTLGNLYATAQFVDEMRALDQEGKLRIRTSLFMSYTTNCGDQLGDWYKDYNVQRDPALMLRILGIKIFADGGSCGRPAISFEYRDAGGHGDLFHTQEFLNKAVQEAENLGYQVAIHAQGDLGVEQALNAIEYALDGKPNLNRHRIEHNAFVRDDQLPRYGEIGAVPIIFGAYATCNGLLSGSYERVFGAEELDWLEDWRRFLDANPGISVAWHGDDPWVPPVSPILDLYGYVTRNEVNLETGEVCEAPDWLRKQSITVGEALRLMTWGSAYALFMEEAVGTIRPGKFADLIVLSDNPLAVDVDRIKDLDVVMTMIGGRIEFCSLDYQSICTGLETELSNLALDKPVFASRSLSDQPPQFAVDGDFDNWWNSGDFAPQWIEIDLLKPRAISKIRLTTSQDPSGETIHRVLGRPDANQPFTVLHEFNGFTADFEKLELSPVIPWSDIRYVRIETISSPSWIAWREIEIFASE